MATRSKPRTNQWSPANDAAPARGPAASVVRWLIVAAVALLMVTLAVVVVVGAFGAGPGFGIGALVVALVVAYVAIRER